MQSRYVANSLFDERFVIFSKEHINFAGGSSSCPVIISAIPIEKVKGVTRWRVLYRNKKGDYIVELNAKSKGNLSKQLRTIAPDLQGDVPFFEVRDPELIEDLKHMEDRHLIKAYKFGVIYCKENEVDENDMFSNTKTSPEFEEFLSWMGEKVRLKGYKGFRGGLDVEHNTTGSHSYVTNFKGFDIMYHISTELPFDQKNPQQVERKRHIGNDVVVIVFQDGPNGGFKPSMITSKFNHVYVVIQPVKDKRRRSSSARQKKPNVSNDERIIKRTNSKKKNTRQTSKEHVDTSTTKYRISIVSKHGVKCHGPVLPNNKYVWPKNDQTREYLLTKLINSERAAYYAPDFGQARTRRLWLKELLEKYQARLTSK